MIPEHIDPKLQQMLRLAAPLPKLDAFPARIGRVMMTVMSKFYAPRTDFRVSETVYRTSRGGMRIHAFRPQEAEVSTPLPALLYLHGGGWTLGRSSDYRPFLSLLARLSGCFVYALDYRLAPEHPFPHALDDVALAWEWLVARQPPAAQHLPLLIGGDSAGGNLATVHSRRLRDRRGRMPDGQFLIYPVTSLRNDTPSHRQFGEDLILTTRMADFFASAYVGTARRAATIDHADLSPLLADELSGLPPTYIALAAADILHDEGVAYAKALQVAGVPTEMQVFPDMIHGFLNLLAFEAPMTCARICAAQLVRLMQRTHREPRHLEAQ